jgi:hypothetical protein
LHTRREIGRAWDIAIPRPHLPHPIRPFDPLGIDADPVALELAGATLHKALIFPCSRNEGGWSLLVFHTLA